MEPATNPMPKMWVVHTVHTPQHGLCRADTCITSYIMCRRFEFTAGSPVLDLIDTVSGRAGIEIDLLPTPATFGDWLVRAGVLSETPETITPELLGEARALRDATFRCASAAIEGAALPAVDVDVINCIAGGPSFRPQLHGGRKVQQTSDPVPASLSHLAADAIEILTPPNRERLRTCLECKMLFIDRSRPGRRRWCSSSSGCGNRIKVRNFRNRQAAQKGDRA